MSEVEVMLCIRTSFVLGGRAMEIVYGSASLRVEGGGPGQLHDGRTCHGGFPRVGFLVLSGVQGWLCMWDALPCAGRGSLVSGGARQESRMLRGACVGCGGVGAPCAASAAGLALVEPVLAPRR